MVSHFSLIHGNITAGDIIPWDEDVRMVLRAQQYWEAQLFKPIYATVLK